MLSVFIVDDDKIIRKGLKRIIEKNMKDFEVVGEASNGLRAMEKIKEIDPNIVITDIKMPVMDGIELLSNLHKLSLNIRAIVLSGFDDYKYVRQTFKEGAVDYLLKPIDNNNLFMLLTKIKREIEEEKLRKEKFKQFNNKVEESYILLKESFLKRVIKRDYANSEHYKVSAQKLNLCEKGKFFVMVMRCDNFKMYEELDKSEFSYIESLKNWEYDILKNYSNLDVMVCDNDEYITSLIYSYHENIDFCSDKILNFIKILKLKINIERSTFSCGISREYYDLKDTYTAFKEAEIAINKGFYNGKDSVYFYDKNDEFQEISELQRSKFFNNLSNSVELCNLSEVVKAVDTFFNYSYEEKINVNDVRNAVSNVIYYMRSSIKDFKSAEKNITEGTYDLADNMSRIAAYVELRNYFINKLCDITKEIVKLRVYRGKRVIEKAKQYISENYMKEITLKDVAEHVYLNPNYFSELFRNEVGKNFMEYVIETRIKASKELLKRTNLKIYEVAEKVGYNEAVSFTRAFKKVIGVSPKEYVHLLN